MQSEQIAQVNECESVLNEAKLALASKSHTNRLSWLQILGQLTFCFGLMLSLPRSGEAELVFQKSSNTFLGLPVILY